MGAFEQLFGPVRGEFEQKLSKNSNARGVARGGWWSFDLTGTLQSSKRSFRKIQNFKSAYSALPQFYSLFRLKSSLHRVVYTKRVKETEEISCISLQSSKRSFRKIQIFKFAYSALPLFYSLFRLSNSRIVLLWQWHWICSFHYKIIHFVWFHFVSFRFVSQNTVSRIFDEEKFSAWFQTTTNPPWKGDELSCLGIHVCWAWNRGTLGRNGTACISVESQYPTSLLRMYVCCSIRNVKLNIPCETLLLCL